MQGLNQALLSTTNHAQVQNKQPVKTDQNDGGDSFYKMIENSVKEYESSDTSQSAPENETKSYEQSSSQTTQNSSPSDKTTQNDNAKSDKIAQNSTTNQVQSSSQSSDEIMLENADFITLLSLLETSDGSTKTGANLLSSSLNKFLATEQNIKELKGAKSLQELINLSDKFGLGLSKIKISKDGFEALKSEFKNLNAKGFFNQIPALSQAIDLNAITKKDIEKALQKTQKDDKSVLSKLMQGQSVELDSDTNSAKKLHTEAKIDTQKITEKLAQATEKLTQTPELNKEIKETKDAKTTTTLATPNATKSQSISSIDDYLANIMQRAMRESGEQSAKAAMATTELATSTTAESAASEAVQSVEPTSQASAPLKDVVNSAKLNAKELNLRQVFDNFSTQLQEKISEYKPPITRFHLTLNPGNLGEVEITLINRGSNLHINFNSNNQTMQLFMQHQAEFRASLVNMGFSELSMNFNDNSNKEQSQGQNKRAKFTGEDGELVETAQSEESILEVVLPKYF